MRVVYERAVKMAVVEPKDVLRLLGCREGASERELADARRAIEAVSAAARPHSLWRLFELTREGGELFIAREPLRGRDIERHLEGCEQCATLCVTLGVGADACVRSAAAESISFAATADCAASALCEAYCDELETAVRELLTSRGKHLTARFSPGYGDLPLETNVTLGRLLDLARAAGVTVNEGGALLPRKSVIALCGVSQRPVKGALAGCESCALKERCESAKGGRLCER